MRLNDLGSKYCKGSGTKIVEVLLSSITVIYFLGSIDGN